MMRIARLRKRIAEKETKLKEERERMTAARHAMSDRVNALLTANQALNGKTANIQTRRQQLATGRCAFAIELALVHSRVALR